MSQWADNIDYTNLQGVLSHSLSSCCYKMLVSTCTSQRHLHVQQRLLLIIPGRGAGVLDARENALTKSLSLMTQVK